MTIKTNLDDRKELAKRLIPFNHNEKLNYAGPRPSPLKGTASAFSAMEKSNAMTKRCSRLCTASS